MHPIKKRPLHDCPVLNHGLSIKKESNNLKLFGAILSLDADTLCQNENYIIDLQREKEFIYWSNINEPFSFCDYLSYQDSEYLSKTHGVHFPEMVSFGDIYIGDRLYPASVVENSPWQVLLIVDSPYQSEWVSFMPIVILSILFMLKIIDQNQKEKSKGN